jgi:hypothetical protein
MCVCAYIYIYIYIYIKPYRRPTICLYKSVLIAKTSSVFYGEKLLTELQEKIVIFLPSIYLLLKKQQDTHWWIPGRLLCPVYHLHSLMTSSSALFVVQMKLTFPTFLQLSFAFCFLIWIYSPFIQIEHQTKFSSFLTYFNSF